MRWWSGRRLLVLALTLAILAGLFSRLDLRELVDRLAHVRPGWLALVLAAQGLALLLGAWRWHVALRVIRCVVHVGMSVRFGFIGHFFSLIHFTATGGDAARTANYARRFGFGRSELAALAPMNRALGVVAVVVVGAVALGLGWAAGGGEGWRGVPPEVVWSLAGLLGLAVLALPAALKFWMPAGDAAWARGWRLLREGFGRWCGSPRLAARGVLGAVGGQLAMSMALGLCVYAVSGDGLPWRQLAWTFPVILLLSGLPLTVAGVGVREVLSIVFLGWYGVPAAEAVAASLLYFSGTVAWGLLGGTVLAREEAVQARCQGRGPAESVSVIIPVLNEAEALPLTLEHLRRNDAVREVIVVDGGSTDGTMALAAQLGCVVLHSPPGRGGQMRMGAAVAKGEVVLLLHADTWLEQGAIQALRDCLRDRAVVAGGFWKEFREPPLLLLGSKGRCGVRLFLGRRVLGDQAMFIRREALDRIGGVPDVPLMEEFFLCSRLRREGRLALADAVVLTSARRFRRLGVLRTYARMGWVTLRHRLGTPPETLRKLYED